LPAVKSVKLVDLNEREAEEQNKKIQEDTGKDSTT